MWHRCWWSIEAPAIGRFHVDPSLRLVAYAPNLDVDPRLLELVISGGLMTILLTLRRQWVLHASGIVLDGLVFAFIGTTGQGKTTMAAVMAAGPATFFADDLLRIDPQTRLAFPGTPTLRLRPHAASIADRFPAAVPRSESADGRIVISLDPATQPLPLGALVIPIPDRGATRVEATRLRGGY
jgi:hypothetical protein